MVIVHGNENNRIKWLLGVIVDLFEDADSEIKLRLGKSFLERPVQQPETDVGSGDLKPTPWVTAFPTQTRLRGFCSFAVLACYAGGITCRY